MPLFSPVQHQLSIYPRGRKNGGHFIEEIYKEALKVQSLRNLLNMRVRWY